MFLDANRVHQLLREIFFEHQTFALHQYLTSAYLDQRRAARTPTGLIDAQLALAQPPISETLRTSLLRTPLEMEILSWVFSGSPVVLIQSGAGSGKSSAIRHLKAYSEELERGLKNLPAGSLVLIVDLQDAPEELKQDESRAERQREQADSFVNVFCERLDTLISNFGDKAKLEAFQYAFHTSPTPVATGAANVRRAVSAASATIAYGATPPEDLAERSIQRADLSSPHDRAVARLLFLQAIATLQAKVTDLGLVLIIDNVDPFPEYLQTALMKTIQTIVYGMHTSSPTLRTGLTIAVFARLSTSTRQSGALDGVEAERFNFRAADPADIVFFRLASFVQRPESVHSWTRLNKQDRREVLARSVALMERLLDSQDQFSRVFSALAGTNIRTACKFARKWIMSHRLSDAGPRFSEQLHPANIKRLVAFSMFFRVALAIERIFLSTPNANLDFKSEIADKFFSYLFGVMWTTGLVNLNDRKELTDGTRRSIPSTSREDIEKILRDAAVLGVVVTPIARAASDLTLKTGIRREDRLRVSLEVANHLKQQAEEKSALLSRLNSNDIPLARLICEVFVDAVRQGVSGGFSERSTANLLGETIGITMRGDRPIPSRWESISMLISGAYSHEDSTRGATATVHSMPEIELSSLTAVNVFCPDQEKLLPIALHVLCILRESPDGVEAYSLQRQLTRWGFKKDIIAQALSEMVDIDRRLIFSAVKDAARGVQHWFDGFHKVHISSSGIGYLESVVPTPAYLQWAFLEVSQVRDFLGGKDRIAGELTTGLRRLALAKRCLEFAAKEEEERLRILLSHGYTPFSPSLSPFSCVFFRSLHWFVEDISGLIRSNYNDALMVARSFMGLGRQLVETRSAALGMMDPEWESSLLLAEQEVRNRFKLPELTTFSVQS